jgi:hypothetical protein
MQLRNTIAITTAGLAACATPPAAVDNTPENPTAVLETVVVNGGINGMFPFEINQKEYVRPNMRRDERNTKGTGTFSGFLVTRIAGGGDGATITRLDQDKLWWLNLRKKEYTECPAHGCPVPPAAEQEEKKREEEQAKEEPKQQTEEGCVARVTSNNFDVKPTGEKKSINGFDSSQYTAAWVIKLQDPKKRTTTSTVSFDVWTTQLAPQMRQAFAVEQQFNKAYVGREMPSVDRSQVMPPEVIKMMTGYLSSMRPADRAALNNATRQLAKIQGHPVYTHIEWRMEGDACGDKGPSEQSSSQPSMTSMSGVISNIGGLLGKKEEKAGPKPILSFTYEVKALGVQPVRDSAFAVPAGYKKAN